MRSRSKTLSSCLIRLTKKNPRSSKTLLKDYPKSQMSSFLILFRITTSPKKSRYPSPLRTQTYFWMANHSSWLWTLRTIQEIILVLTFPALKAPVNPDSQSLPQEAARTKWIWRACTAHLPQIQIHTGITCSHPKILSVLRALNPL